MKRRAQIHIELKHPRSATPEDLAAAVLIALRHGPWRIVWGGDRAAPRPKDESA
jgi:hypothetical protein